MACAPTGKSVVTAATVLLRAGCGGRYFAWGCFRDFCPGPAVHRGRDAMLGDSSLLPLWEKVARSAR